MATVRAAQGNANGGVGQEATIGWLRHSEIKHGRIAMVRRGVLLTRRDVTATARRKRYATPHHRCAGRLPRFHCPVHAPRERRAQVPALPGYVAGCTPQEQWDNIPLYGKLQIFVLVGMLESYGEGASQPDGYVHYM